MLSFVPLILIAVTIAAVGFINISSMNAQAEEMFEERLEPIIQLAVAEEALYEIMLTVNALAIEHHDQEHLVHEIEEHEAAFEAAIEEIKATDLTEHEREEIEQVEEQFSVLKLEIETAIEHAAVGELVAGEPTLIQFHDEAEVVIHELDQIISEEEAAALELEHEIQAEYKAARIEIALVLAIGLLLALVIGFWVARILSKPLQQLAEAAQKAAEGDLSVSVEAKTKDEVGRLASAFNEMITQIRRSVRAVEEKETAAQEAAQQAEQAQANAQTQQQYLDRNIDKMLAEMSNFAEGDLTVHLEAERDDGKISELFQGFNRAVSNIRALFVQVSEAVALTKKAATEISSATEELAAGAEEQSQQTGEVAAAVEEMARTIIENASNATRTAEVAKRNGEVAQEGGQVVAKTVEKIRQIAEVVGSSAETVVRLGSSSEKIGDIVSVIDEIADQTNMLALNAAIEAARAGEQGRGFAVVADEVRKLAERTTSATKQIAEMIQTIQSEAAEAVAAMEQGNEEVRAGIELADQAGKSLKQIVSETQNTVDMINQIATASDEQSSTSEQISRSVEMISTVTDESARGVGDIARSSDELNRQMDELSHLVAQFKTDDRRARTDRPAHARNREAATQQV